MNKRLVYILVLIAIGFVLTSATKYLPAHVILGVLLVLVSISLTHSLISIRKRSIARVSESRLQKASYIIMLSAAFGGFIAVMSRVFNLHNVYFQILNFSLFLFLVGALTAIIATLKSNNPSLKPEVKPKQPTFALILLIYLCIICTITGMLLKINHYKIGQPLMFAGFWGLFILFVFLILFIFYKKNANKKLS